MEPIARTLSLGLFLAGISVLPTGVLNAQTFTDRTDLLHIESQSSGGSALGATSIDFNGDGLVDIYQTNRLYLNKGQDGFEDIYGPSGLDEGSTVFGGIFGDYNNDGFMDVFFMDLTAASHVFRGRMDGTFVQSNSSTGIDLEGTAVQGSLWLDYNNDGLLDLYVGGDGQQDVLYRNVNGNQFQEQAGMLDVTIPRGVYGAAASDFDKDGDMDIYIAACRPNDIEKSRNMLWLNVVGDRFLEQGLGIDDTGDGWGVVWLDFDNDTWMDLYVVNSVGHGPDRSGKNLLYRKNGHGGFDNVAEAAGVAGGENDFGFSASAADFDNDGWIDLYVINYNSVPDRFYHNNGDGTFTDVFASSAIEDLPNLAVTVADYDNDGSMDIFMGTMEGGKLLMNDGAPGHWLKVGLRGVQSTRNGIGARLELYQDGRPAGMREIVAGDGMTSQSHALTAHFGLGDATLADSLLIYWPSGTVDHLENISADQRLLVTEGSFPTSKNPEEMPMVENMQVFPNPFGDNLHMTFSTSRTGTVQIGIFDVLGRRIETLVEDVAVPGSSTHSWDGRASTGVRVAPGLYIVRVESAGGRTASYPVVRSGG